MKFTSFTFWRRHNVDEWRVSSTDFEGASTPERMHDDVKIKRRIHYRKRHTHRISVKIHCRAHKRRVITRGNTVFRSLNELNCLHCIK